MMKRTTKFVIEVGIKSWLAVVFLLLSGSALAQREPIPGTYVTTTTVNVRQGPGTEYRVVATIPADIRIHVVGREGYWLKVQSKHGNPPGYIDDRYARPLENPSPAMTPAAEGWYLTTDEVNLREGPGLHYRVLSTIPKGIKIYVAGAQGDWLRVESKHGKPPGYIDKRFAQRQ